MLSRFGFSALESNDVECRMRESRLPDGTLTFLFTDLEGSTRLWESHAEVMRSSLARHDALVREAIEGSNGYVFKTMGDAFCSVFATAGEALEAALNSQLALASEPWPVETPMRVRMALHTGAVESRDSDYFGPPVNRVARLLATAHGGQILLTLASYELVRDALPQGVALVDLGAHQLKDLSRPEQVFQLLHPSLRAEYPPIRSLSSHPNNLPLQLTSFIGRDEEMRRVLKGIEGARLVTLTGSGGSGKTRLGLQVAAESLEQYPDGAWLVELASTPEPAMVTRAVADVLNVAEVSVQDLDRVVADHIGTKTMLLVLDNCEHVIEACAKFADTVLRSCPNLQVLATSREALGISGESIYRVPPLSLPDLKVQHTTDTLSHFEAARLFIDRALQSESTFTITNESAPALASLCCRLDGIPLAIELAAARVRSLSIEQIDARLDQRFRLLTGGSRTALPRQQTLRSLIDWSYDLLQPLEKRVFERLSVFSGGWTLDASEIVCSDEGGDGWEVSDTVLALVDKSLVVVQEHRGRSGYGLLESVREYAKERLKESGEATRYQERHLAHFARMAAEALPHLRGPQQKEWLQRLEGEIDNFRAALSFGVATKLGLSIAADLWWFWYLRGQFTEGRAWLASTLDQNPQAASEYRAKALNGAGVLAEQQADFEEALEHHQKSLEINRSRGDRWHEAVSLNNMGNTYGCQGDFETAGELWESALAIWRELESQGSLEDRRGLAATLDNLGNVASAQGRLLDARELYKEGLALRQQEGSIAIAAYSMLNLSDISFDLGEIESARAYLREGLEIVAAIRDEFAIGFFFMGLAQMADPTRAAMLLGRFERIREDLGTPIFKDDRERYDGILSNAKLSLADDAAFDEAWALGRSMPLDEALGLAEGISLEAV